MHVFTLSDPFTDEVFYVGKSKDVYQYVGNMLLRPAPACVPWFDRLKAAGLFPAVKVYVTKSPDALKGALLLEHAGTVVNRRGACGKLTRAEIAAGYSARLRARLRKMGVSIGKLQRPEMVIALRERGERHAKRLLE